MGISINDYINTLRVNEFRRLLNDKEVSLEEAVERAGFQSMRTAYRAAVSPMFKFSDIVRRVIYTTNAIESLNSGFRRLNRSRNVFPDSKALLKALYLAADNITKKWTNTLRDWGQVYAELFVMYGERLS